MGADLYIESLFNENRERALKAFNDAVRVRDALPRGSAEYEEAQTRVSECYEKLYTAGYFRDSYNASNLLWQFGLSWWQDVADLCDDDGRLEPAAAETFLTILAEREDTFRDNLSTLTQVEAEEFEEAYAELRAFLGQAIALKEPIRCSL